jgi:Flp pilus assembly protein TadG
LFVADRRGSAAVLGAILITSMVVIFSFIIQVSDLYIVDVKAQRTADLAALAGTVGASPVLSSGAATQSAVATALNVANVNGPSGSTVTTTGASNGNGSYSLTTKISTSPSAIMGTWINGATPTVRVSSQVSLVPTSVTDCVAAIGGPFQVSGSATILSSGCGAASSSTITMSGGSITGSSFAVGVNAYQERPQETGGSTTPAYTGYMYNAQTVDMVASNSSVAAAKAHLASLATWPYGSTIPQTAVAKTVASGTTQSFNAQTVTVPANTHWGSLDIDNATLNFAGSGGPDLSCSSPTTISGATTLHDNNTLNFASGCYIFNGNVSTDYNASTTNFAINSGATVVFYFQGGVTSNTSAALNFGNAYSYAFLGNINQNTGGTFSVGTGTKIFTGNITIGYGTVIFGNGTSYLNGTNIVGNNWPVNSLTFGNGPFYLWNGSITQNGSKNFYFGSGPYYFYNSTINDGQQNQGSIYFAGGDYYFYGGSITTGPNINCTMRFLAGNADLYNGTNITVQSSLMFGNGPLSSGGSRVSVYGGSITVTQQPLTILGGTLAMSTGSLNISGGTLSFATPTNTTPTYGYKNLAILSTSGAINLTGGTSNIGGMIYAPNSTVALSNSAILQPYNGSYCLSVVANSVTLSDSASASLSPCAGMSQTSTGTAVMLNQ